MRALSRLLPALALLLSGSFCHADDRRIDTDRLRIMTLNAEFLWDGVEPEEGMASFDWKGSQTEAEEHMKEIADLILAADPDIVNLVELEGSPALEILNDSFLGGMGYRPYLIEGRDTATGQDVGLLTRIDPAEPLARREIRGVSGTVQKGVSKHYIARIHANGYRLGLIGLQFRARPNDETLVHVRQAQADAVRTMALELRDEGWLPIVLGDFNDFDGRTLDHIWSLPITTVLSDIRSLDPEDPDDDLTNVAEFVPPAFRYTAHWDRDRDGRVDHPGEHSSLDHILIAPELEPLVDAVQIPHGQDPLTVSDHYPIIVELGLGDGSGDLGVLSIYSLLPNPPGNENENEAVTLVNEGGAVALRGYILRDKAGTTWDLPDRTIARGETLRIPRNGMKMALNNRGDRVDLIDPEGNVLDTVTYGRTLEGEEVYPN